MSPGKKQKRSPRNVSSPKSPKRTPASGRSSSGKRSGSKPSFSPALLRGLVWTIMLLSLALLITLVILDKKAVDSGKTGLWRILTRTKQAETIDEVDVRFRDVLAGFGLTKMNLFMEGTVPGRKGNRLLLRAYDTKDPLLWIRIGKHFELECEKAGIKVYNRSLSKTSEEWNLYFFLGTPGRRTHKIRIRHRLKERLPRPSPTPFPVKATRTPFTPAIALVFDDFGADISIARDFLDRLHVPITLAVMPYQAHTVQIIKLVHKQGQTVFLHLPMEPEDPSAMGDARSEFLRMDMSETQIRQHLNSILDAIPPVDGINNHMGSRLTADRKRMRIILGELKRRGLPFLDSRTSPHTVAAAVAAALQLPHVSRAVFLDQGYKGGDVEKNLQKLVQIAREKGSAVGIGHAQPATLATLEKILPSIMKEGIRIVPVTALMSDQ